MNKVKPNDPLFNQKNFFVKRISGPFVKLLQLYIGLPDFTISLLKSDLLIRRFKFTIFSLYQHKVPLDKVNPSINKEFLL